jgi:ParB family transcriptional regulator, chromosome partitioning protein
MSQTTTKPLSWFKAQKQVRSDFGSEAELRQLGESLEKRQLQSILAQPDGTIIAGERRFRAAQLVGLESLEVKIADRQLSDSEVKVWQLVENLARKDLSSFEKWVGCSDWLCANQGADLKDLAKALSLDASTVTRILSPSKCIAEVQNALKTGKIGISDCYAMSKLDAEGQRGLLALKLSGASRDTLEQVGRRHRNGRKPAKLSRVQLVVPSGVSIVVSGERLSLDTVFQSLADALKEVRTATQQQYDLKTLASVMKDKAKAKVSV